MAARGLCRVTAQRDGSEAGRGKTVTPTVTCCAHDIRIRQASTRQDLQAVAQLCVTEFGDMQFSHELLQRGIPDAIVSTVKAVERYRTTQAETDLIRRFLVLKARKLEGQVSSSKPESVQP
jgi:hypothetical protein